MKKKEYGNFFRFLIVGSISTSIDFVIYLSLANFVHFSIAKCCSFIIASIFSFFMNKSWTFNNKKGIEGKIVLKYIFTQSINIVTNVSINAFVFSMLQSKVISFILATGVAMMVNYTLQRRIVFNTTKGDE